MEKKLRPIVVDNESYLWLMRTYYDIWEGTLAVYSPQTKAGRLEVHYKIDEHLAWSPPATVIVYEEDPTRRLNIHEPETISRMIRYARKELGWNPTENKAPTIIENGFEVLKKLGYITRPIETATSSRKEDF